MAPLDPPAQPQPATEDGSAAVLTSPIAAAPITSAHPTATGTRHRRSASDIKPTSPAARRMSMSATPQTMKGRIPRGPIPVLGSISRGLAGVMRRPLLGMAALLSTIVLLGTAYSSLNSLALDTSLYPSPSRTAYFAQKTNIFNQYFVKLAWLHTSLIYLPHLFTTPSPSRFIPHLWSYVISTAFWAIFTTWFFGRGLGDRIIELSGGKCVIALPTNWGLDRDKVQEMMALVPASVGASLLSSTLDATTSSLAETANSAPHDDNLYLAVPSSFCTSQAALTPKSAPDIFSILSALPFPQSVYNDSERPTLAIPRPRWFRGHDISGHVFILVLSSLLLTRRLLPTWRRWMGAGDVVAADKGRAQSPVLQLGNEQLRARIHAVATVLGTALLVLWLWMTLMTATYFHNPQEKISGLVLGLTTAYLVDVFTPSISISPSETSAVPRTKSSLSPTLDENGARRGDDGLVQSSEADAAGTEGGKDKVE